MFHPIANTFSQPLIQKLPRIRAIKPSNPHPLHIRLTRQLAVYGVAGFVHGHPVGGAAAGFAGVEYQIFAPAIGVG